MNETSIPHAFGETVVSDFPRGKLHVATKLALDPGQPGFDAVAKAELVCAVVARCAADDLEPDIHWAQRPREGG
jgi:hypothetical protein